MQCPAGQGAKGVQAETGIARNIQGPTYFQNHWMGRQLIMETEISKNIKEMSQNAAPGPDGLSVRDLIKISPHYTKLMELFSLWLASGTIPDMVRECNTVLTSKSALPGHQNDINNWQPIAIGSTTLKLFSRI